MDKILGENLFGLGLGKVILGKTPKIQFIKLKRDDAAINYDDTYSFINIVGINNWMLYKECYSMLHL